MTAILLAALAAVLYGLGAAVEHRQAARVRPGTAGRLRWLGRLVRQPLWLAGAGLEAAAFGAHAAALSGGALAAVQLVLGCSLVVSVAASARLAGRALPRRSWPAMLVVVAAAGASVSLLRPDEHSASHAPGRLAFAVLIPFLATAVVAGAVTLVKGRRGRAGLLAAGAGLADTGLAVVTMAFAHSFGHGPAALLSSWPVYALLAGELVAVSLTQSAYQADLPLITLPVMATVTPLASLAVGIAALHETANVSGARLGAAVGCAVIAAAALAVLARGEGKGRPDNAAPKRIRCLHSESVGLEFGSR